MLTRRDFIQKLALVTAGAMALEKLELLDRLAPRSLFPAGPYVPHLWGDGIHDDTRALQYLLDHRDGRNVLLPSGTFRITDTLRVNDAGALIDGNYSKILSAELKPDRAAVYIDTERDPHLPRIVCNFHIDSRPRVARYGVEHLLGGPAIRLSVA